MAWFKRRSRRRSGADNAYPYTGSDAGDRSGDDGFRAGDVAQSSSGGFFSGFFGGGDSGDSGAGSDSGGGGDGGGGGGGGD